MGTVQIASAADMPAKAPIVRPPPVFNWTGFYVGAYVGGAWAHDFTATDLNGYNAFGSWGYGGDDGSVIAGGTIGYNWQPVGSPWVFGLEGEIGYINISASGADPISPGLDTIAESEIGDWYGLIAGRIGYAWDRLLIYAKGGGVFTRLRTSVVDACAVAPCGPALIATSAEEDDFGWAVGAGLEYAFANNWSIKAEYLFLGVDRTLTSCGIASTGLQFCWDNEIDGIHTAKVGINYRFATY
jgi:outer membrane immunogenic protein